MRVLSSSTPSARNLYTVSTRRRASLWWLSSIFNTASETAFSRRTLAAPPYSPILSNTRIDALSTFLRNVARHAFASPTPQSPAPRYTEYNCVRAFLASRGSFKSSIPYLFLSSDVNPGIARINEWISFVSPGSSVMRTMPLRSALLESSDASPAVKPSWSASTPLSSFWVSRRSRSNASSMSFHSVRRFLFGM